MAPTITQMTRNDRLVIGRMRQIAGRNPCLVPRMDLMRLMMLASLAGTKTYRRLALNPSATAVIEQDVLRCMCRLAAGSNDTAAMVEERLIENEAGHLTWEARLTLLGEEMRDRLDRGDLGHLGPAQFFGVRGPGRGQSN
jgi:hypothetical protein